MTMLGLDTLAAALEGMKPALDVEADDASASPDLTPAMTALAEAKSPVASDLR